MISCPSRDTAQRVVVSWSDTKEVRSADSRAYALLNDADYVITPAADTEWMHYGQVAPDPSYVFAAGDDGAVDATGELNVARLAKVKVFVQAKRCKLGAKVNAGTVKQLLQAIPFGGQGAFITTADFHGAAADVALKPGFVCLSRGNRCGEHRSALALGSRWGLSGCAARSGRGNADHQAAQ